MADVTFARGDFDRYNASEGYLKRARDPDSVRQSAEDEKAWAYIIDMYGDTHRPANHHEDTKKHFDVVQFSSKLEREIKYEVKGPKALKRGTPKQEKFALLERRWIYDSEANFFCFRRLDGRFLVVSLKRLKGLLESKNLDWDTPITHPRFANEIKSNVVYIRPNEAFGQGKVQSPFVWIDMAEVTPLGDIYG